MAAEAQRAQRAQSGESVEYWRPERRIRCARYLCSSARKTLYPLRSLRLCGQSLMLDQLGMSQEVDGSTMLDNTVLLWGNELGVGNTHDYKNIPWVLAGGAGGYLKSRATSRAAPRRRARARRSRPRAAREC